jgi:hypothetical protein
MVANQIHKAGQIHAVQQGTIGTIPEGAPTESFPPLLRETVTTLATSVVIANARQEKVTDRTNARMGSDCIILPLHVVTDKGTENAIVARVELAQITGTLTPIQVGVLLSLQNLLEMSR